MNFIKYFTTRHINYFCKRNIDCNILCLIIDCRNTSLKYYGNDRLQDCPYVPPSVLWIMKRSAVKPVSFRAEVEWTSNVKFKVYAYTNNSTMVNTYNYKIRPMSAVPLQLHQLQSKWSPMPPLLWNTAPCHWPWLHDSANFMECSRQHQTLWAVIRWCLSTGRHICVIRNNIFEISLRIFSFKIVYGLLNKQWIDERPFS